MRLVRRENREIITNNSLSPQAAKTPCQDNKVPAHIHGRSPFSGREVKGVRQDGKSIYVTS